MNDHTLSEAAGQLAHNEPIWVYTDAPAVAGSTPQPYDPDREALLLAELTTVVNATETSAHSRIRRAQELLDLLGA